MENQVFVFGSFSEDEASFFQSASPELSPKLHKLLAQHSVKGNGCHPLQTHTSHNVGTLEPFHKKISNVGGQENIRLLANDRVDAEIEKAECDLSNGRGNDSPYQERAKDTSALTEICIAKLSCNRDQLADGVCVETWVSPQNPQDVASASEHIISSSGNEECICRNDTSHKEGTIGNGGIKFDILPAKDFSKSQAAQVGSQSNFVPGLQKYDDQKGKHEAQYILATESNADELVKENVFVMQLTGGAWLKSLQEVERSGKRLQPRGLINTGNLCFLNATLQALMSCTPFVHLLQTLQFCVIPQTKYPTLRACVDFLKQFEEITTPEKTSQKTVPGEGRSVETGRPFAPTMFDNILKLFCPDQPSSGAGRNRQEDAQEFLSFTMDHMHEELLRLEGIEHTSFGGNQSNVVAASDEDDWETVGPKNRSAVIRTYTLMQSALSDIFGGQLCSIVKTKGSKASATVQPFLLLHLDILPEVVHSVEDALRFFAARESLEDYRSATSKAPIVSASKSLKIQSLPRVLILHLMRFSYGVKGSNKLHKPVCFPLDLTLNRELLASSISSASEGRRYELVATVSHHGRDPSRGHYTADSKQPDGQWLRFDDAVVSIVGLNKVLHDQAYLLFYRRVAC